MSWIDDLAKLQQSNPVAKLLSSGTKGGMAGSGMGAIPNPFSSIPNPFAGFNPFAGMTDKVQKYAKWILGIIVVVIILGAIYWIWRRVVSDKYHAGRSHKVGFKILDKIGFNYGD